MSMIDWTLQKLSADGTWGEALPLAALGVRDATRRLVNQGVDTCTLSLAGMRPPYSGYFASGQVIRLLRDDHDGQGGTTNPVGWFTGRIVAPQRSANGNSEASSVVLNGPWWDLANVVYRQVGLYFSAMSETDATDAITDAGDGPVVQPGMVSITLSGSAAPQLSSSVLLTQGNDTAIPLDGRDTITGAIAYAMSKGARLVAGTIAVDQAIPAESLTDPTCADCIRRVLKWLPSYTAWVDYSQDPPAICVASRAARNPKTLTMGGDSPQVQSASLTARPDLVLPGVTLQYLRRLDLSSTSVSADGATTTSANASANCLEIEQAGPDPDGMGAMVSTIELTGGSVVNGVTSGATIEPTPTGLAQAIYDGRKNTPYQGTITLATQDLVQAGSWIGRVLNLMGGDPEWETMAAEVQTIEESVAKGTTSISVGPPDHLGPSDLAALLRASRLRTLVNATDVATRTGGTVAVPPTYPAPPAPPTPPPPPSNPPKYGPPQDGNGDHSDDDGTGPSNTTQIGGTGAGKDFSGTTAIPLVDCGPAHTGQPPETGYYYTPYTARPSVPAVLTSAPQTPQGTTSKVYASFSGSSSNGVGFKPNGSYYGTNGDDWFTQQTCTAAHSEVTLDLSAYTSLKYIYAELRGTVTYGTADGQQSAPIQIPITGYLGRKTPGFSIQAYIPQKSGEYAVPGAVDEHGGASAKAHSESITITGLYLKEWGRPAGPPPMVVGHDGQ